MTCAVVLPGTGSDDRFVRSAFAGPLAALGVDLIAPAPRSGADVVACYREALDHAARGSTSLLVGGISLGVHVAVRWAASAPQGRLRGLLLALPAWSRCIHWRSPDDGTGCDPRSALVTARLAAFGADPETIGRAAVLGWLRAAQGR